jgi:predicted nucleic acid-binding protein
MIDSSLWIDYFRPKTPVSVKALIDPIVRGPDAVTCEVILFELLRAVPQKEAGKVTDFFATMPVLETPRSLWTEAGRLGQKCTEAGFLTPVMDLLIAQVCIHHEALVTTFDEGFAKIADVSQLRVRLLTRPARG